MENFLKSKKGKMITFLTRACYYDLPYDENIDMTKFTSKSRMDVIHFKFDKYDLILFQGTSSLFDWIADFKMALGIKPRQFKAALKFVKENINKDKQTYIAGHSLGGAITQYVVHELNMDNVYGYTYNGAGAKHLLRKKREHYKVYNYIGSRDILNRITRRLPFSYFKHIGNSCIIEDNESKNGIYAHSNFHVFMK